MSRHDQILATIRSVDPNSLSTPELFALCDRAAPGVTPPEIIAALDENIATIRKEAEELRQWGRRHFSGLRVVGDEPDNAA